jgi:eukaryotic-like serine/threonine-protein kinase
MPNVPHNDESRDERVNEAIASFLDARDRGESPDPRAFLDRHPDIAKELSQFFTDQAMFVRAAGELPGGVAAILFKPAPVVDQPTSAHVGAESGNGQRLRYFGDYESLEEIARGGMGVVYKARQVTLNRTVAVKMILGGCLASPDDVKRFRVEAEAAAQLDHPGIVPIYEVGEHEGNHYYSMGFVDGPSLAARVTQGPLPPREAAELVRAVAEAVHYAHEKGVIHRDLKPSNVLLDEQGRPRVTDFGLAKLTESASGLTGTGQILGTPSYMPPEQAAAQVRAIGRAADVYSMGAILYCLLTGRPPFQAATPVETLPQVQQQEPVPPRTLNPDVPLDLDTIALKCLDKNPHRRYGKAQELADELDRFRTGRPIRARRVGAAERGLKWLRRHPAPAALMLVTAVAVLAVVAALVGRSYNAKLESVNDRLEVAAKDLKKSLTTVEIEKKEADRQRALARAAESKARRYFYAAQMAQVEQARKEGQTGQVLQILRSVIPDNPDQDDPRGWEWHHLWRFYHGEDSRLRGHKGAVTAVAFSPDDKLLASGGDDATIRFWDVVTGKETRTLKAHSGRVTGLSFSPKGERLASSSADGTVKVWDVAAGRESLSLTGHEAAVTSVAFSPDDRHIASGSDDKSVRLWDTTTGETVTMKSFANPVSGVDFSPDGQRIACVTRSENEVVSTQSVLWEPFQDSEVQLAYNSRNAVAFSPDGKSIASAATAMKVTDGFEKPHVIVCNASNASNEQRLAEHESTITDLAFTLDGKWLASSSFDQTVRIWDATTYKEVHIFHDQASVYAIAFSPDGLRLASASGDGSVKIWSLPGMVERTVQSGPVNSVVFSPDGRRVVGACRKDTVVWDVIRCQEIMVHPVTASRAA